MAATSESSGAAVEAAWMAAVEVVKTGPPASHFILLENPMKPGLAPADINTEFVLSVKHLLVPAQVGQAADKLVVPAQVGQAADKLVVPAQVGQAADKLMVPAQVGQAADKLAKTISYICRHWMGGGTSCGNAVWFDFMMPKLTEAEGMIQRKQWSKTFSILLGLQLFANYDDDWIRDQEVYCEFEDFSGWFSDYSKAWLEVLGKSDSQLGLAVAGGKEGGYRAVVRDMVQNWETETNELLRNRFDEFSEGEGRARVRMFSDAGSSEEELEEEDEDESEDD